MLDTWRVIGCFEQAIVRKIPCIPAAAVRPSDNSDIVYWLTLRGEITSKMSVQMFHECVELGRAFRVDLGEWPANHVLFIEAGELIPTWVTVEDAQDRFKVFVYKQLEIGYQALPFDREKARHHFDLARRVSKEPQDIIRVCYLLGGNSRSAWTEWLEENYPDLDHRAEALKLGLIAG